MATHGRLLAGLLLVLACTAPALGHALRPLRYTAARAPTVTCAADSFPSLGLRGEICDALNEQGIHAPNELQARAIPVIAGRTNLILGAQTGSGKTMTYLLPIMQNLKSDEEARGGRGRPKRPRAVILLPTRELSLQVRDVAKSISKHLKLSVAVIHGGVPEGPQRRQLEQPLDVLIATPGRLMSHLERGNLFLGGARYVVLDEVDTMFEAGFGTELDKLLEISTRDLSTDVRAAEEGGKVQHLAVGATHPAAALALYDRWLKDAKRLMLDDCHSLPSTLEQRFITCSANAKLASLREVLGTPDEDGKPSVGRVVLFCNSQDSARFVDHTLVEEGFRTANYHGAVPANTRAENFAEFCDGEAHVLVTTDLAARGLDKLDVSHVVQFDFPKTAADYIHRCGRTARAGRRGTSHSLVTKHDTELVRAIRAANSAGSDVVVAGDAQKKAQKLREKFELQPPPRSQPRGDGTTGVAAAFPESFGLGGREVPPEGAKGGRGSRAGSKVRSRGRGGSSRRGGGGAAPARDSARRPGGSSRGARVR